MVGICSLARGEARKVVPIYRCFQFWMGLYRPWSRGYRSLGDYWSDQEKKLNIPSKEMLAICHALEASPKHIRDCRVDLQVDSRVAMDTYYGQGSRKSHELTEVTKQLYQLVLGRILQLELSYVPSKENEADAPSRRISAEDATLSANA